jgi:dynein heavy chain
MLNQVELFWKTANLNITQYKDKKNQYILGDLEELIAKIDDNLMSLNNIMASRFVDTIRSRVDV